MTQGGNAVDSAITTALCQGIMSPAASGLGGGNFMIIRSPNGTTEVIDAREVAPAAATENMFKGKFIVKMLLSQHVASRLMCRYTEAQDCPSEAGTGEWEGAVRQRQKAKCCAIKGSQRLALLKQI